LQGKGAYENHNRPNCSISPHMKAYEEYKHQR
jgi:hypothetical protein